MGRTNKWTTTI